MHVAYTVMHASEQHTHACMLMDSTGHAFGPRVMHVCMWLLKSSMQVRTRICDVSAHLFRKAPPLQSCVDDCFTAALTLMPARACPCSVMTCIHQTRICIFWNGLILFSWLNMQGQTQQNTSRTSPHAGQYQTTPDHLPLVSYTNVYNTLGEVTCCVALKEQVIWCMQQLACRPVQNAMCMTRKVG